LWRLSFCYVALNSCAIISALDFEFKQGNKARIMVTPFWGSTIAIFFALQNDLTSSQYLLESIPRSNPRNIYTYEAETFQTDLSVN
jgi:hypothetical protein